MRSSFPSSHFWTAINSGSEFENLTFYNPNRKSITWKFAAATGRCQLNALQIPPVHVPASSTQALLSNNLSLSFSLRFTSSLERNNKKTSLDRKRGWTQNCFTANKAGHLPLEEEWMHQDELIQEWTPHDHGKTEKQQNLIKTEQSWTWQTTVTEISQLKDQDRKEILSPITASCAVTYVKGKAIGAQYHSTLGAWNIAKSNLALIYDRDNLHRSFHY